MIFYPLKLLFIVTVLHLVELKLFGCLIVPSCSHLAHAEKHRVCECSILLLLMNNVFIRSIDFVVCGCAVVVEPYWCIAEVHLERLLVITSGRDGRVIVLVIQFGETTVRHSDVHTINLILGGVAYKVWRVSPRVTILLGVVVVLRSLVGVCGAKLGQAKVTRGSHIHLIVPVQVSKVQLIFHLIIPTLLKSTLILLLLLHMRSTWL